MSRQLIYSNLQEDVFNSLGLGRNNIIVKAVAGSGKSTTLIECTNRIPSTWIIYIAFGAPVVEDIKKKIGTIVECKTIHQIGYRTCAYYLCRKGEGLKLDENKYHNLIEPEVGRIVDILLDGVTGSEDADELPKGIEVYQCIKSLVNFCQLTLTDVRDAEAVARMIDHYGIDLPIALDVAVPVVARILAEGIRIAKDLRVIDFNDMVWLPHVLNLRPKVYQFILCDEAQDLNAAQCELVMKMKARGGQFIWVGDPNQAIYGFAGADAASFWRIKNRCKADEYPLSVCYRCPTSVIELAQQMVPEIEAAPGAIEGQITDINESQLLGSVREGDLLLSRTVAPLVKHCLLMLAAKIPARVKGQDIGQRLILTAKIISEMAGFRYERFGSYLNFYEKRQTARLQQRGDSAIPMIQAMQDTVTALRVCWENFRARSLKEFSKEMETLFSDSRPGVMLSTIHRAKGLEEDRVMIIEPHKLPLYWAGQRAWEAKQERNIKYVAFTRPRKELVFVEAQEE